jgi:peptidoglycan hydrolase-like protein with peptidoglycan-binding domain
LDTSEFNSRGMVVIGLAVLATVILLAVVPKNGSLGGVRSVSTEQATGTTLVPGTTQPGPATTKATATTTPATATTKKGSTATTTTTINPASRPTLQLGQSGPDVVTLQQKLIAGAYLTGTADGNFGPATKAAVIKFQQAKGLNPADGVVGPATWAALG